MAKSSAPVYIEGRDAGTTRDGGDSREIFFTTLAQAEPTQTIMTTLEIEGDGNSTKA